MQFSIGKLLSRHFITVSYSIRLNFLLFLTQLKKVIRHIVDELKGLGLAPEVLRIAIEASAKGEVDSPEEEVIEPAERDTDAVLSEASRSYWMNSTGQEGLDFTTQHIYTKAVYELKSKSGAILPQLRVLFSIPVSPNLPTEGERKCVRSYLGNDVSELPIIPHGAASPLLKGLTLRIFNHGERELSIESRVDYGYVLISNVVASSCFSKFLTVSRYLHQQHLMKTPPLRIATLR